MIHDFVAIKPSIKISYNPFFENISSALLNVEPSGPINGRFGRHWRDLRSSFTKL